MKGGRGKRVAMGAGVLGIVVLIATGVALKDWIREEYWLRKFFERLGKNAQGYSEYRHKETGIVFVRLLGGKFLIGAQNDDPKAANYEPADDPYAGPVREVTLGPFLIGKCEVTQGQWEPITLENPSSSKGRDLPVEGVSWNDCQWFCRKVGLKLPTMAQFWYAHGAGAPELHAGSGEAEDIGLCQGIRENSPAVPQDQPNTYGLHDMSDDLEWCEDVSDKAFYSKPEASGVNPVYTTGSKRRVLRVGSFRDHRGWFGQGDPDVRLRGVGLRVVASPPP